MSSETSNHTATDSQATTNESAPVTPEKIAEVAEVIEELKKYRERLVEETTTNAKKAKLKKSKMMQDLEGQLAYIDTNLENLSAQYAVMTSK